jgi:two-component system cell cycle sensor histidine kinase/response regulator CckA
MKFRELSLRTQLLVLAILLTLPSLGAIIFNGLEERREDLKAAGVETQKLADNIAAEQEHLTHEARQLGRLITELPDVKQRNTSKVQAILSGILKDNPQYLDLVIADRSGDVWASAVPFKGRISIADRRYFKNALASRKFSSGEYVLSKVTRKPILPMGYPLFDKQGEFDGVIAISFNLDQLKPLLERSRLPNDTNYIAVDFNGIILSRGHDDAGRVGTFIRPEILKRLEAGPEKKTYEFIRKDGDKRIATYRKLWLTGEEKPYMYVVAGVSAKTAMAKANRDLLYNVALFAPFVVSAFALTFYIGKRSIADKVTILESAAWKLAQGMLPGKITDLVKGGELGRLG